MMRRRVLVLAAAMTLATALAPRAVAEVPVPRLPPQPGVAPASLTVDVGHPAAPRTEIPLPEAIERELKVDVSNATAALYERRDHRPVWDEARAKALRARLAAAALDGLDPADYFVPHAAEGVFSRAAEDVSLTEAALRYARHAHSGRVDPKRVSRIIDQVPPALNESRFLNRLAIAGDVAGTLESAHPVHPQYRALREALRAALAEGPPQAVPVGSGPNLRIGARGPRVATLRSRIGATVRRGEDPEVFDAGLAAAVRAFQRENGLGVDGIVGPRTLGVLDEGLSESPVAAIVSNMERWRWMPRHLGRHHVRVNIPAFRVRVERAGETIYDGRVVVGRPGNPTPVFSDEIEHVVVNPYWNVPYSIAVGEMLGGFRANPSGYAARRNLEVLVGGRRVDPAALTWNASTMRRVRIRQRPGRGNALGRVKFLFPNDYAVYLHDTPSKHLFRRTRRAYSHGCVRVQNPFDFADALLAGTDRLSGPGLERMTRGPRRWMNTERHIPVHLTYFTVEVNEDGDLVRHGDIYGFDRRTQRALGLEQGPT
jgi:murein L,D-transpeptidase YcbB/YkuD